MDSTSLQFVKVDRGRGIIDYVAKVPVKRDPDGGIYRIDSITVWYNRCERSWVGMMTTARGYQMGSSEYAFNRQHAIDAILGRYNSI
jgi:hypothetical protein